MLNDFVTDASTTTDTNSDNCPTHFDMKVTIKCC